MSNNPKSFQLSTEIHEYIVAHGTPPDAILAELIEETNALGQISLMQVAPEQGAFLSLITRLIGARNAIEVGTFTGFSSLCIARGLPADGKLICCDVSEEWTGIARKYWEKAGVADRVDLRIAPALETLAALPDDLSIDLAFIDADKSNYHAYYEALLGHVRPGGLILVDNVLWHGAVVDEADVSETTLAIRAFNDAIAEDERVDRVMLPIADGLTLLRVRGAS